MKSKGLGVTELANTLGVNRQTIYYYIKQDDKNPVSQLKKIASALGVPVTELFDQPKSDVINCPNCGTKLKITKE
jgi:transcriptional regulator with XRE-family HTH domain